MAEQDQTKQEKSKEEAKAQEPKTEETKVEASKTPASAEASGGKEEKPAFAKATAGKPAEKPAVKPAPSGKFADLIKQIENLKVTELAQLVKELEERFGVSAAAPAMAAPAGGTAAAAEPKEEKANYTVVLSSAGEQKIAVIKAVREINPDLGLKEAKDLVEAAPKEVKKDMPAKEAEEAKKKLEAVGAKVELK